MESVEKEVGDWKLIRGRYDSLCAVDVYGVEVMIWPGHDELEVDSTGATNPGDTVIQVPLAVVRALIEGKS